MPKDPPRPKPKSNPKSPSAYDASKMFPNAKPKAGGASGYAYTPKGGGGGTGAPGATVAQARGLGAGNQLGPASVDAYAGLGTPLELLMNGMYAMFGPNAGSSGGGGSGGGGGGAAAKPGDPDPMGWNATAQQQAMQQGYAEMLAAQDAKAKSDAAGFDARTGGLNTARDEGANRLASILAESQGRAQQGLQATQGVYQAGQGELDQIMGQYQNMIQGRQAPAQATVQAFGGDPTAVQANVAPVQDMMTAQKARLSGMGTADQALMAGRQNVYNGLNSDVATAQAQQYTNLNAKLLADKQAVDAANAASRAKMAMELQQQMLQLQAAEQARKASYQ